MIEQLFVAELNSDDSERDLEYAIRDALNLVPQDRGIGDTLRRENTKGNKLIPNTKLPSGTSKVVGNFLEKENQRVFYFVYNSEENHCIFEYNKKLNTTYLVLKSSVLSFSDKTKITGVGVLNNQLIFTDTTKDIRSIDIVKGKNTFDVIEKREWHLLPSGTTSNFVMTITRANSTTEIININGSTIDTVVTSINTSTLIDAEKCGKYIKLKEKSASTIISVTVNNAYGVAPINFYPTPLVQRQINLINQPYPYSPTASFGTDTTRSANFVNKDGFQFAIRYIYHDNSPSTFSPYSQLIMSGACATSEKQNNYITVTFNQSIYTPTELMLIKNVEVFFRKGNTGVWYKAVSLDRNEYYKGTYVFYNDGSYNTIDAQTSSKLFDSVPNKVNALTILKNRLFLGGYTEGYDTPCVDASVDVDISDGGNRNTWTITGRVRIVNRFIPQIDITNSLITTHYNQPIHSVAGEGNRETWVYGGMGGNVESVGVIDRFTTEGKHQQYGQFIPEGGFTLFLAGTNFYSISKQVTATYSSPVTNDAELVSETPIVYNTDDIGNTADPNNERGRAAVRRIMAENNMYSTFEIKGVPAGKYILRVASPLCARTENLRSDTDSFYDLNGNINNWQSTSANILNINGNYNNYASNVAEFYYRDYNDATELIIELGDSGGTYDIHSGDSNKAVLIADMTSPNTNILAEETSVNQGYVVDAVTLDEDGFKASLRMEKQKIGVAIGTISNLINISDFQIETDANGFWWFGMPNSIIGGTTVKRGLVYNGGFKDTATFPFLAPNENGKYAIKHWNQVLYDDTDISDVYNGNIIGKSTQKDFKNNDYLNKHIIYNHNPSVRNYGRTQYRLTLQNSLGVTQTGILTLITNTSRYAYSDTEGVANIVVYADEDVNSVNRDGVRRDTAIIGVGNTSCLSFEAAKKDFDIRPIRQSNGYNNTTPFLDTLTVLNIVSTTQNIHKRGGIYKWGLVYYDFALRSSFVVSNDNLRKRIPSLTDDLGDILPTKYSPDTFKYGTASIAWNIQGTPPDWAYYYQWVRTKDTSVNSFLTWSANMVLYVQNWDDETEEPITTTFGTGTANEIYIDISNMREYANRNSFANVGYNYAKGDRIILIKNDGSYFENYIDIEVRGQRGDYIIIENLTSYGELKNGLQFQVYTPKLQNEQDIFYEIGEVYTINNPTTPSRSHSVTSGTFVKGDTYNIVRNIPVDIGAVNDIYEHQTPSDRIDERMSDIGRPNVINKEAKREYFLSGVRYSNSFIQDSFVNGLHTFDTLDKQSLPIERGAITKMIGTTNVILTLHQTETTSLYIGEGYINTTDGQSFLTKTDKVIADDRLLKGEFGTIHPESVAEYDDVVFWYDHNKGDIIRYSNNGLISLGLTYKYKNKLLDIQGYINQDLDNSLVVGGFNPIFDSYLCAFKNINGEEFTIMFRDKKDAFITRFSFSPENFVYIDQKLYSFKNGLLYEHDADSVPRNNFYGTQYNSKIHVVSNENNIYEKIYKFLGVKSNNVWKATEIYNEDGQMTDLEYTDFIRRDDSYYADILRDKNTSTDTLKANQVPLLHGEVMRSQTMNIVLENNSTNRTLLDYIVVGYQLSDGHLMDAKNSN